MLIGQLLVLSLLAWWLARQWQADPVVTVCSRCGDLVRHVPGLPTCCPSCGQFLI